MAEYTFADVIIDPDDPRLEVGKKYYYSNYPGLVLVYANNDNGRIATLEKVDADSAVPFIIRLDDRSHYGNWACLILKKDLSYAERQAKWLADNGINKGDKVRIVRKADDLEEGWESRWNPDMDEAVGKVGTVSCLYSNFSECGIEVDVLDVGQFLYPYFVLEKVEPRYVPFDLIREEDRAKLRGAWIRNVESGLEYQVICIGSALVFVHNGDFNAGSLLEQFVFLDGTPCGKLVEE